MDVNKRQNINLKMENDITVCEKCHFKYAHSDPLCTNSYLSKLVCQRIIKIKEKINSKL